MEFYSAVADGNGRLLFIPFNDNHGLDSVCYLVDKKLSKHWPLYMAV
jgi:hypothetical protein